jgi:hypothetical protein
MRIKKKQSFKLKYETFIYLNVLQVQSVFCYIEMGVHSIFNSHLLKYSVSFISYNIFFKKKSNRWTERESKYELDKESVHNGFGCDVMPFFLFSFLTVAFIIIIIIFFFEFLIF